MTVNIAFKAPDALVFVTDGLATLMKVDENGEESFLSNMESVEKLVVLSNGVSGTTAPVLAMFNGVGSLGAGAVATDLRAIDNAQPRRLDETVGSYLARVADLLRATTLRRLPALPRPFHLIAAGFDGHGTDAVPSLHALQWRADGGEPLAYGVLESSDANGATTHQYGAHYVGLTEAVARFVEGYDPGLPEQLGSLLAGMGGLAPPGLLERLAQEACRTAGGRALSNDEASRLVDKYTFMIVRAAFQQPATEEMSQHFSLQSAIDYCVFLAQCAYARENLSPTRKGAPRVGSTLQVAYVAPGQDPVRLAGIRLGIRVHGYTAAPGVGA
ncbi:MAG TPA: hypothetical protein VGP07_04040 [Polyangia bacterium]|jgi:hypothetical protein